MNKKILEMRIDSNIFDWDICLYNIMKKNGIDDVHDLITCLFMRIYPEIQTKKRVQNIQDNLYRIGIVIDDSKLSEPLIKIKDDEELELEKQINEFADRLQINIINIHFSDEYTLVEYELPFSRKINNSVQINSKHFDEIKKSLSDDVLKNIRINIYREYFQTNFIKKLSTTSIHSGFLALGYTVVEDSYQLKKYQYIEEDNGYCKYIEIYRTEFDTEWKFKSYEVNNRPTTLDYHELEVVYNLMFELQPRKIMSNLSAT